ncbi:MAG: DinB family protein [candidate division Zixibacteria bacterium]|nr:DinB family protein [candidate division Zixibacteria bacterium]
MIPDKSKIQMLCHFLAALAYRTQKSLRGAPENFADFRVTERVRTPKELIRHMTVVIGYARTFFVGGVWRPEPLPSFSDEIKRFHETIEGLADCFTDNADFGDRTPERLLQGPLADAMTHAGQLAMLRRLFGSPVPSENFVKADINASNLGPDQPNPVAPDDDWKPNGSKHTGD